MDAFSKALRHAQGQGLVPVIADIKCTSPKEGDLLRGRDPVEVAKGLEQAGAPALSVVTESAHFGGSLALLEGVAQQVSVPVLRKDFIYTLDDLKQTKSCGARAVLLMCAVQPEPLLESLFYQALELGLQPFVEAHTPQQLAFAAALHATLVGINNRDILALERDEGDVAHTQKLARYKPENALLISESGIATPQQARQAIEAGCDGVLVGTALWQAPDMVACYRQFARSGEND